MTEDKNNKSGRKAWCGKVVADIKSSLPIIIGTAAVVLFAGYALFVLYMLSYKFGEVQLNDPCSYRSGGVFDNMSSVIVNVIDSDTMVLFLIVWILSLFWPYAKFGFAVVTNYFIFIVAWALVVITIVELFSHFVLRHYCGYEPQDFDTLPIAIIMILFIIVVAVIQSHVYDWAEKLSKLQRIIIFLAAPVLYWCMIFVIKAFAPES